MPAQGVVNNYDDGVTPAQIAEIFQLKLADVIGTLESVRRLHKGLQSFLSMSRIEAR